MDTTTIQLKKVNIIDEISTPLTNLINRIFETGICPIEFKLAIVIPIYKKRRENETWEPQANRFSQYNKL